MISYSIGQPVCLWDDSLLVRLFLSKMISYWSACYSLIFSPVGQPVRLLDDLLLVSFVFSEMISNWSSWSSLIWSPIGQPVPLLDDLLLVSLVLYDLPLVSLFFSKIKSFWSLSGRSIADVFYFPPTVHLCPPRQQPALPRDLVGWGGGGNIIPYPWRIILRRLH